MALYRSDGRAALEAAGEPIFEAVLPGERHTLRPIDQGTAADFTKRLADQRLYVADGHHRYETALAYRDQVRAGASAWTGEEPENFILAALIDAADPGLVVLATHRLLRLPNRTPDLASRLTRLFDIEDIGPLSDANLDALMTRLSSAGRDGPAYGAIGLQGERLHLIKPRDVEKLCERTPADHSEAWRRLDVTLLEHALAPVLGYDGEPRHVDYTEDHRQAAEAVASGRWDVALLLNPTPVDQVIAVAEAGDRMPRKSTYFYPKLATGMVMLPLD
jgi:uncharacterized protein (DUF1015 family)